MIDKSMAASHHLIGLAFVLQVALFAAGAHGQFRDVSRQAGLIYKEGRGLKFGGASIADLDGNGCPDLLLGHHTNSPAMEIYFNNCNGTFTRSPFRKNHDIHAITPFRAHASHKSMHFIISLGGNRGRNPRGSALIRVSSDRSVADVSSQSGLLKLRQRGRGGLALDLRFRKRSSSDGYTDILLTSQKVRGVKSSHAALTTQPRSFLKKKYLSGDFTKENTHYIAPIDVGSDGRIEILGLRESRVYEVVAPFKLIDVTKRVFPDFEFSDPLYGVSAVAEADFNGDGRWDLYLARAASGDLSWLGRSGRLISISDIMMFGTGDGKYEDVSRSAGILSQTHSRGVTTGDFDNDGDVDILVITFTGRDFFYMNNGDGTFQRRVAPWFKRSSAHGDTATAVDYDGDGRLDIVLSEGDWGNLKYAGFYRIMKNFMPHYAQDGRGRRRRRNYLLVRVGSSLSLRASSMHAVVQVWTGNQKMMRRVGAPGVAVSVSYIELVHFGLGFAPVAKQVKVTWTDGSTLSRWNIQANSRITIGRT